MGQPILLIISVILLFMVFIARASSRVNVPLIIIALAIGIIFGSDVTGLIYFDDAVLTSSAANIALIFILFAGGLPHKVHTGPARCQDRHIQEKILIFLFIRFNC